MKNESNEGLIEGLTMTRVPVSMQNLEDDIRNLEQRLDALLQTCQQLKAENDTLRDRREELLQQHTRMAEKNRLARVKIDTIIGKLKVLDNVN